MSGAKCTVEDALGVAVAFASLAVKLATALQEVRINAKSTAVVPHTQSQPSSQLTKSDTEYLTNLIEESFTHAARDREGVVPITAVVKFLEVVKSIQSQPGLSAQDREALSTMQDDHFSLLAQDLDSSERRVGAIAKLGEVFKSVLENQKVAVTKKATEDKQKEAEAEAEAEAHFREAGALARNENILGAINSMTEALRRP